MNRTARTALCAAAVTGLLFGLGACAEAEKAVKAGASEAAEASGKELDKIDEVDKALNRTFQVTYEVTGKDVESIEFAAGGGTATAPKNETVDKPALPWKKTVTLKGVMPPAVIPTTSKVVATPDITCKVVHEGKVLKEASGEKAMAGGCIAAAPLGK
ncbi:hypothetical protein ACFYVL_28685 [Streptomyces sp. NPDC004111]|uniref:hypothetical protein n=1 Tax=Streptomyces sp. NPDC004111 TaxID=3364690 RepID=UPI0036CC4DA0